VAVLAHLRDEDARLAAKLFLEAMHALDAAVDQRLVAVGFGVGAGDLSREYQWRISVKGKKETSRKESKIKIIANQKKKKKNQIDSFQ
jgi:hypothetical protein